MINTFIFVKSLNELALEINENAKKHGFWDGPQNQAEKIALMHSELSEALEALRRPKKDEHRPSFESLEIELADCIIRILDFCCQYKLHIADAILAKHEFNKTRIHKHGKEF